MLFSINIQEIRKTQDTDELDRVMQSANPHYILRNHMAQKRLN